MSGWDGAGNFTLPYVFATDAANGVKILSARQDTQWTTVVNGLMNCQTRDGQNKPTADWDFDGKKITNLGAPASATDIARLGDIQTNISPWIAETNSFAWVSATQFKITGIDRTAIYKPGRSLKIVHNGGASTRTAIFVSSSSFSTDTTVTVEARDRTNPALVSTLTAVNYALEASDTLSIPAPSLVIGNGQSANTLTSGANCPLGKAPFSSTIYDAYGEFDTSAGTFTPKIPGMYLCFGSVQITRNGATYTSDAAIAGGLGVGISITTAGTPNNLSGSVVDITNASAPISILFSVPGFTGGPLKTASWVFGFVRIR